MWWRQALAGGLALLAAPVPPRAPSPTDSLVDSGPAGESFVVEGTVPAVGAQRRSRSAEPARGR
jgi:hypothetical protein